MASPKSMNLEQLKAYKAELEAAGRSGGKEYGKVIDLIKTKEPEKYGEETVSDAYKKLSRGVTTPGGWTEQNAQQIYEHTGQYPSVGGGSPSSSSGTSMPGSSEALNLSSLYDKYFNTPEIQAKKTEASAAEKARDAAIGSIQNNPWYSQGTRGGKIAAIKTDAERNLERINNELTRLQTDGQIQYNIKLQQYDINRQAYQDSLTLLNTLINSGALSSANPSDIGKLSVQTGIPSSMITSMAKTSYNKSLSLQSFDDGSGQYVVALDPTGKVVNKTWVGASSKNKSDSDKKQDDFDKAIDAGIDQLKSGESWGTVWNRIKARFPDVPNSLIDAGLGIAWREGGAYEDYARKIYSAENPGTNPFK